MATWRDIALLVLVVEAFVLALVPLVLLAGINYLTLFRPFKWWRELPRHFEQGRYYLARIQQLVEQGARIVVTPILLLGGMAATIESWVRGFINLWRKA